MGDRLRVGMKGWLIGGGGVVGWFRWSGEIRLGVSVRRCIVGHVQDRNARFFHNDLPVNRVGAARAFMYTHGDSTGLMCSLGKARRDGGERGLGEALR